LQGALFRFVVLHHTGWISSKRGNHWDWMLEPPERKTKGLITFASIRNPRSGWDGELLDELPPHRSVYLDYEGPISGDRGQVQRVATGRFRWMELSTEKLTLELVSMDFSETPFTPWPTGRYCLTRETPFASSISWRLIHVANEGGKGPVKRPRDQE
jgi:hypothetical protein